MKQHNPPPPLCWCKKSEKGSTDETLTGLISPLICAFQTKLFTDMGVTQGGNRRGYTAEEVSKAESPLLSSRSLDVESATLRVKLMVDSLPESSPRMWHRSIGKMCRTQSHFTLMGFNLFSH